MIDKRAREIKFVSQIICLDVCMNIFSKLLASKKFDFGLFFWMVDMPFEFINVPHYTNVSD